jgi:AraC-type DNA-binding domain-containing proteins
VKDQLTPRISPSDLDQLMTALEVSFIKLSECVVSPGWRLRLGATNAPGIHYNLSGRGKLIVADQSAVDLVPHTLVVIPPRHPFSIEVDSDTASASNLRTVDGSVGALPPDALRRFVAGEGEPKVVLICGYFRASYGTSIELFDKLDSMIVEQFEPADQVDRYLKASLAELLAQETGTGAMTTALLKQVLIVLLRRSLRSTELWMERFSMLSDPQIARAFSDMVTRPGSSHSVESLADAACLSRSAFMARFVTAVGRPPMEALRELRMRQAAILLAYGGKSLSVNQVARSVGYAHRGSFFRAFRRVYGKDPSEFRSESRVAEAASGEAGSRTGGTTA